MDLDDGKGSGSSDSNGRSCADCRTTKTPLWRGGPSGPKSLCNACGIKYSKKRRVDLGLAKDGGDERKRGKISRGGILGFVGDLLVKERCLDLKRRKLREEEEAAVLLMALSSGILYA